MMDEGEADGNDCTSACWWMVAARCKVKCQAPRRGWPCRGGAVAAGGGGVQKAAAVPSARGRRSAAVAAVSHLSDGRPTLSIEMTTLLPARRMGCQGRQGGPASSGHLRGRRPPAGAHGCAGTRQPHTC